MAAVVSLEHVRKAFRDTVVLKDITLAMEEHEFLVVVGPSGCGKSTLLRIIAGLESVSAGHLRFGADVANNWTPYARNVGMVFQNYALYPHLSVYDNLAFGLMARRVHREEVGRRVSEVAHLLELESCLQMKPGALSGGQRQRVALGRALVRQPRLFLMDEPLSNLDALLRERMRVELRALFERVGIPTLYVTHDQTEAMTMADRIVVMRDGEILQVGPPEEIYQRPRSVFVAQFFGSPAMNVVPVRLVRSRGIHHLEPEGAQVEGVTLPPAQAALALEAVADDGRLQIGFRAEAAAPGVDPSGLSLPFQVMSLEALGPRYHIHGRLGEHAMSVVAESPAGFRRQDTIPVSIPWDRVHWFSGETGLSVEGGAERLRSLEGGAV